VTVTVVDRAAPIVKDASEVVRPLDAEPPSEQFTVNANVVSPLR